MSAFIQRVLGASQRLAMPIAVYPGLALTKASVQDVVTNVNAQFDAQAALQDRYQTSVVLSAMDLSAEAEAFGCQIYMSRTEIPAVTGRLVTSMPEAERLGVPHPGDRRTGIYLEMVSRLRKLSGDLTVLGGCIGPFSLAARLVGVSEAMELTLNEPELMHLVVKKSAKFLAGYAQAFVQAGAHGLIMAEPAAGLLSPRGLAAYSSRYVREISETLPADFSLILHNCAAKTVHLSAVLDTNLKAFHFGAPMDVAAALANVPPDTLICGNLDPTGVFVQCAPDAVAERTYELLQRTAAHRNFVISSGCDIPPNAPLASLDAFFAVVKDHNASHR